MEYQDTDDLPVVEVGQVLSREQKLVFALTWPTQLFWLLVWAAVAFAGYAIFGYRLAHAQHQHPQQDVPLHERFYSTWYMPDNPSKSCCNLADCYPTVARFVNQQWYARRREDGEWLPIPWEKVERNRDNPDGQSHMCAPSPTATYYPPKTVFCFSLGGGT